MTRLAIAAALAATLPLCAQPLSPPSITAKSDFRLTKVAKGSVTVKYLIEWAEVNPRALTQKPLSPLVRSFTRMEQQFAILTRQMGVAKTGEEKLKLSAAADKALNAMHALAKQAEAEAEDKDKSPLRFHSHAGEVEVELTEKTAIRAALPPRLTDAEGKPRNPTAEELRELKGKGNLPGYRASTADLKVGLPIELIKAAKVKDKDNVVRVSAVLIIGEPGVVSPGEKK